MAEEAPVVNDPAVQSAPVDPTPTETEAPVVTEAEVESDEAVANKEIEKSLLGKDEEPEADPEQKETPEESEVTEEAKEESEDPEKPQGKAEDRKQQLNTEIRDLISQRNTLRQQVEEANGKVYQPATESELLEQTNPETGENYSRLEAKLAAMEQAQEIATYNTQIAEVQLTLSNEAQAALKDFPMFDSESESYNPTIAAQVDKILGESLIVDPNTNQVIGSHVSPYQLYKTIADASNQSAVEGQAKAQKATDKMQSRVDSTSSSAPAKKTTTSDDNFLKGLLGEQ